MIEEGKKKREGGREGEGVEKEREGGREREGHSKSNTTTVM